MRKHFHTAEAIFRRRPSASAGQKQRACELQTQQVVAVGRGAAKSLGAQSSGKLSATGANAATGALGISSRICAIAGRARRIATSIPPALTFKAVANSRNSLPLPSRLRTKTGIASGNLAHFRRSLPALSTVHADLSIALSVTSGSTLGAKCPAKFRGQTRQEHRVCARLRLQNQQSSGVSRACYLRFLFAFAEIQPSAPQAIKSASFCYTWVIPVHFPLTTNCA